MHIDILPIGTVELVDLQIHYLILALQCVSLFQNVLILAFSPSLV